MARVSYQPDVRVIRRRHILEFALGETVGEIRRCLERIPDTTRAVDVDVDLDAGTVQMTFEREEEEEKEK